MAFRRRPEQVVCLEVDPESVTKKEVGCVVIRSVNYGCLSLFPLHVIILFSIPHKRMSGRKNRIC